MKEAYRNHTAPGPVIANVDRIHGLAPFRVQAIRAIRSRADASEAAVRALHEVAVIARGHRPEKNGIAWHVEGIVKLIRVMYYSY